MALVEDLSWIQGLGKVQHIEIDVCPDEVRLALPYNFTLVFPYFYMCTMHGPKVLNIEAMCWPQKVDDQPAYLLRNVGKVSVLLSREYFEELKPCLRYRLTILIPFHARPRESIPVTDPAMRS